MNTDGTLKRLKELNGYAIPAIVVIGRHSHRGITAKVMAGINVGIVDVVVKADIQKKDFMCNCTTQHSSIDRV